MRHYLVCGICRSKKFNPEIMISAEIARWLSEHNSVFFTCEGKKNRKLMACFERSDKEWRLLKEKN